MGMQANDVDNDTDDWVSNDEESKLDEDKDPCCSKLWPSNEEKCRIGKLWRQRLIIKLLGRSIGCKTLF